MNARLERVMSVVLTLCAVAIAATVVHREFVSRRNTAVAVVAPSEPVLVPASLWEQILRHGIALGDVAGPVQLVEFVDLECPACRRYHQDVLKAVRAKYGDRVTLELTRFRGRLTRPNLGAEVAYEIEQETSTA